MSEASGADIREETRQILETLVKRIANDPEGIKVTCQVGERTTIYMVDCSKDSIGRIIGSKGKNITSLRNIIAAIMAANGIRAIIEIPYYKNEN